MQRHLVLTIAVIFITASAGAISRSGGGRLESADLGFSTVAPATFVRAIPVANAGLRLWSNEYPGASKFSSESFLELRGYKTEFPEFELMDRKQTALSFSKQSWLQAAHANGCVDVYRRDSSTISATALVWGTGRGIVVLGGTSAEANAAIGEIVKTLKLEPGSCAW